MTGTTETDTEGTDAERTAAIYGRVSTSDQNTDSQIEVCTEHARNHPDIDSWTVYDDVQSGHDDDRPDYLRLKADIADGQYDYFICSEFSRISRNDGEVKDFIATCFDRDMGVEIVQSSFSVAPNEDEITKQAMKMVADTLANIATMENLQKIDRIQRGIDHAQEAGKWTGKSPKGFEINDEGYLEVNTEEFLTIRAALLDHHYKGTPWSVLEDEFGINRSTLSRFYNDEEKFALYAHAEGYDSSGRLEAALQDADLQTYIQMRDDAPALSNEDADPVDDHSGPREEDPTQLMTLMRTMLDLLEARNEEEELSDGELLELYERNRETVTETLSADD